MRSEERSRLELLDAALWSENVREHICSVVLRVREELARKKDALMSWEPIPLHIFVTTLPPEIRSAWVFVLRAGPTQAFPMIPDGLARISGYAHIALRVLW